MQLGRMLFYDVVTGLILVDTGEWSCVKRKKTVDEQINTYNVLSERNRESFDVIELQYGQYAQDFAECNGYRVNPTTKTLEFSYPNQNAPEEPQQYIKPLSESVNEQLDYLVDVDFRLSMVELGLI